MLGLVKSDLAVLGAIKKEKRASIRKIAATTGYSFNYIRYLCNYPA